MYPWKVQRITYPKNGRPGNYTNLSHPLPDPPKDQIWVQDIHTREWKLVPLVVAAAVASTSHDTEEDEEVEDNGAAASDHSVVPAASTTTTATTEDPTTNNIHGATTGSITTAIPISTLELGIPIDNTIRNTTSSNSNSSLQIINGIQYHQIQPTDTFQGLCLRYKLTPTELRRANNMVLMDSNLTLHTKLIIPMGAMKPSSPSSPTSTKTSGHGGVDQEKEEKIAALLSKASSSSRRMNGTHNNNKSKLSYSEARAYLEIEDWDVHRAMESVGEDFGW